MVTNQNTLNQDIGISPAEMYDRKIKDNLFILRGKYQVHRHWREMKRKGYGEKTLDESKAL